MGLIDKTGKKVLSKLPDLKIISLARDVMPYISVEAEGLTFFFKNTDHSILDYMVESRKIWACDDMDFILGYYDSISSRPGTVIDIGANVGTSVIYFRNKLGPDTKFYAVEPVTDNFNILKANCATSQILMLSGTEYLIQLAKLIWRSILPIWRLARSQGRTRTTLFSKRTNHLM